MSVDPIAEFEALVAANNAEEAVACAQRHSGCENLREATAGGGSSASWLHVAAAAGASEGVVRALLGAGCALQGLTLDDRKDTPLHVAAAENQLATCQALVAAGVDATLRNGRGRTPRQQPGLEPEVVECLVAAEEASRRRKEAAWGAAVQGTQTQSACLARCV